MVGLVYVKDALRLLEEPVALRRLHRSISSQRPEGGAAAQGPAEAAQPGVVIVSTAR
jgi:hypothetical protein